MMHFMSTPYCFKIKTVALPENFKTLMNKNIVNKKICDTI